MSLEQQVENLSQNVASLTEILEKFLDQGAANIAGAEIPPNKPTKKAAIKKKAASKDAEPVSDPEGENTAGDNLDYDGDVKPAVLAAAKDHRDVVVAALSRFGCKKATELDAEKYGEFLAKLAKGIDKGVEAI